MATILAAITNDARKYWPAFFGRVLGIGTSTTAETGFPSTPPTGMWNPQIKSFKIGEGGWINPGTGAVPRTPDADLRRLDNSIQDLDCVVDPTRAAVDQRYPSDSLFSYQKFFGGTEFTFIAPSRVQIECFLNFTECNDDGFGNYPELWELGIFSDHPTVVGAELMIAYGTFPKEIKDPTKQIQHYVQIVF